MPLAKRERLKGTRHVAVPSETSHALTSCVSKVQFHESSLNVGVGAGALYMLITCQEEMKRLNRTVEETENLVQELKQELQWHHEDFESHHVHLAQGIYYQSQSAHGDMDCTCQHPDSLKNSRVDEFLEEQLPATRLMAKDQMAVLAAELEAELELMELNIKAEESLPLEKSIHDAGEVASKGVSNSYYSDTSSYGMLEVSDVGRPSAQLEASQTDYGVSAIELDHRLRDVLEAQQQERILELEQLLEETKARLLAKEHEIFCWKNHVSSLKNLLHPQSTCEPHVFRLNETSGAESVTEYNNFVAPKITESSVELASSRSSSPDDLSNDNGSFNKASMAASPFFKSSMDAMNTVGIDTPEYANMKDIDAHSTEQMSDVPESKVCSTFMDMEGDDPPSDQEISRVPCSRYDIDINPGRSGLEVPKSHHIKCRVDTGKTSVCAKEDLDRDSDVKHIVNLVMPKPILLAKYHETFGEEAILLAPSERNVISKTKSLQLGTHGRPLGVTSPVLEKIRHFEALGGHAHEKHI